MKVIQKAINEVKTSYQPQVGWWSYIQDDTFYLCRYQHHIGAFKDGKLIAYEVCTITDKRGLKDCERILSEQFLKCSPN